MAAALIGMVAKLTVGKKKYAAVEKRMVEIAERADRLRRELKNAVVEDSQAFNQVLEAYRSPKQTDAELKVRTAAIEQATHHAAEVPLAVATRSLEILKLAVELVEVGNKNAISDAAAAGYLAYASIQAAEQNVLINTNSLSQTEIATALNEQITVVRSEANTLNQDLQGALTA
jgi:formiminotetrahydrofolate cyclodeaminase